MLEGIRIQDGSLSASLYTLGASSCGVLGVDHIHLRVLGSLFWHCHPLLQFKCDFTPDAFTNGQLQMKCSKLLQ